MISLFPTIGIDLGTHKTRIIAKNSDTVYEELTCVAIKEQKLLQLGQGALSVWGQNGVEIVHPVKNSEIFNLEVASNYLLTFYAALPIRSRLLRTNTFISCSASQSTANRQAVHNAAMSISREVLLVDTLTAILSLQGVEHLSNDDPDFVIHIGAGSATVGIFTQQCDEYSCHIRLGGDHLDSLIQRQLSADIGKRIDLLECQKIKHEIGRVDIQYEKNWQGYVRCESGETESISISSPQLRPALEKGLNEIADEVEWFVAGLPVKFQKRLREKHFLLSGGCGNLPGIDTWLTNRLGIQVIVMPEPDKAVIKGIQKVLTEKVHRQDKPLRR